MRFFNSSEEINKDTQFVIFGIPWDYLTSIDLPNSSTAPNKIRDVTNDIGWTSEMGLPITKFKIADVGDIKIEEKNVEKNINKIKIFIEAIYQKKDNLVPIMIGGDHFCSYPVIKIVGDHFDKKDEFGVRQTLLLSRR